MANAQQPNALRQVERLLNQGTVTGWSDRHLLEQFLDRRGESHDMAFAALVERHGPMVRRVCRSILRDEHAADDAFQATFLILAAPCTIRLGSRFDRPLALSGGPTCRLGARAMEARRRRTNKRPPRWFNLSWNIAGPMTLPRRFIRRSRGCPSVLLADCSLLPGGHDPATGRGTTRVANRHAAEPACTRSGTAAKAIDSPRPGAIDRDGGGDCVRGRGDCRGFFRAAGDYDPRGPRIPNSPNGLQGCGLGLALLSYERGTQNNVLP